MQRIFRPVFDATDLKTDGSDFDHLFKDGERFKIGEMDAGVLFSPGHSLVSITYLIGDAVFVYDTMFVPDNGTARADFPVGNAVTCGGRSKPSWRSPMRRASSPATTISPEAVDRAGRVRSANRSD